MAQAVWTGSIAFGLVNVPVKLYTAVTPKDVRFHQFQRGTNRRIRYARVTEEALTWDAPPRDWRPPESSAPEPSPHEPATVQEPPPPVREGRAPPESVPYDEIVKGYEIEPGQFVTVSREELEELAPKRTSTIDIEEFVDLADIDPVYFEKTYYLAPAHPDAVKPYSLLLKAMTESGKVAVGRFVMRTKEYLSAIRPMRGALALHTLSYEDEVRSVDELPFAGMSVEVSDRELKVAIQLISILAATWEPERYRDTYRERVLELIESKAGTELVVETERSEPETPKVADLMDALRKSVEAAKREKRAAGQ